MSIADLKDIGEVVPSISLFDLPVQSLQKPGGSLTMTIHHCRLSQIAILVKAAVPDVISLMELINKHSVHGTCTSMGLRSNVIIIQCCSRAVFNSLTLCHDMVPGGLDRIWTFIASVHCDIMLIRKDEKEVAVRWSPGEDTDPPEGETCDESGDSHCNESLGVQDISSAVKAVSCVLCHKKGAQHRIGLFGWG